MYFMEQVEMNNMYINIGVNNGSEKGTERKVGECWVANIMAVRWKNLYEKHKYFVGQRQFSVLY